LKYVISNIEDVLVIVDVQRDFCLGGDLPVPDGDKIVPVLNKYIKKFSEAGDLIIATRDWHPPNHLSFKEYGGTWPPHCVQGTKGAQFHPDLKIPKGTKIISKATAPDKEAYSGFDETTVAEELKTKGIKRVFVGGLATDYCVKSTVLDALKLGFETILLEDAIRGVDAKPGDSKRAIAEMIEKGAKKIALPDLA
jgi:nicotinamidase-related amidase